MDRNEKGLDVLDYYHRLPEHYFQKTAHVDPAVFLEPMISYLPPEGVVWDVGCGSGRDLRWLKQRGFRVVGLERSPGLARRAAAHAGCRVIQEDFGAFDFSGAAMDGVLLVGAFVHVSWNEMPFLLQHVMAGLKSGGIVFISLKQGKGCREDDQGRRFYLWRRTDLEKIFSRLQLEVMQTTCRNSLLNTGEAWISHLLRNSKT